MSSVCFGYLLLSILSASLQIQLQVLLPIRRKSSTGHSLAVVVGQHVEPLIKMASALLKILCGASIYLILSAGMCLHGRHYLERRNVLVEKKGNHDSLSIIDWLIFTLCTLCQRSSRVRWSVVGIRLSTSFGLKLQGSWRVELVHDHLNNLHLVGTSECNIIKEVRKFSLGANCVRFRDFLIRITKDLEEASPSPIRNIIIFSGHQS